MITADNQADADAEVASIRDTGKEMYLHGSLMPRHGQIGCLATREVASGEPAGNGVNGLVHASWSFGYLSDHVPEV